MKPENINFDTIEIQIYKYQKILKILDKIGCIRACRIGIGKNAIGKKELEGDYKTPEGIYEICVKNPNSKYHLSLGLNYPNKEDAARGLASRKITNKLYQQICDAVENHQIPPWNTPLGGQIYIHGHLEERDWSEGCIRMYQDDLEMFYKIAKKGTRVTIFT